MSAREYHIDITDGEKSAAGLLAKESGLSVTAVKQAMQKGAVWLTSAQGTNRLRRAKKTLTVGASYISISIPRSCKRKYRNRSMSPTKATIVSGLSPAQCFLRALNGEITALSRVG